MEMEEGSQVEVEMEVEEVESLPQVMAMAEVEVEFLPQVMAMAEVEVEMEMVVVC